MSGEETIGEAEPGLEGMGRLDFKHRKQSLEKLGKSKDRSNLHRPYLQPQLVDQNSLQLLISVVARLCLTLETGFTMYGASIYLVLSSTCC